MVKSSHRILVAEDHAEVRALLEAVLTHAGHQVVAVADGEQALAALRSECASFDLLITDEIMPVMGGAELLSRAHDEGVSVPSVVVTGVGETPDDVALHWPGAVAVLRKPFRPQALLDVVESAAARV